MKNKYMTCFLIIFCFFVTACGNEKETIKKEDLLGINYNIETHETTLEKYQTENPVVAMNIENYGSIVMELYPEQAPNTVNNFISLIKQGFYDNNTFHRLAPGFVLQGGDPTGKGTGGPGYQIKGEFSENSVSNTLAHEKWTISMARNGSSYDSAGSQFFIMLGTSSYLDGKYAAFGKIIDGKKTIELIEKTEPTEANSENLKTNLVIKKALIDLKGKQYPEVEKITE